MEDLLTPEELKYLDRVARYLDVANKKNVIINIEANEYDGKEEIKDIEWDEITHFDWRQTLDIPTGFIEILKKIFNYIDQSGRYETPNLDEINYNEFIIEIQVDKRTLTIYNEYRYYIEDGGEEDEIESPEMFNEIISSIGEDKIPKEGILTIRYSGGGDSGDIDTGFEENGLTVPSIVEDFCYETLSEYHRGYENNEGGQGSFVFDFNNKTIYLYHTDNVEHTESNTLFEIKF